MQFAKTTIVWPNYYCGIRRDIGENQERRGEAIMRLYEPMVVDQRRINVAHLIEQLR